MAHLSDRAPTQQPRQRIVRFRCIDCRAPLHRWRDEYYCPDCTRFTPPGERPTAEITVGVGAPEELFWRLHDHGWDVVVDRGRSWVQLYHPRVRTAAEARRALAADGFDFGLFEIQE